MRSTGATAVAAALLAGVAGCFAPTYAPGGACDVETGCPGDLRCVVPAAGTTGTCQLADSPDAARTADAAGPDTRIDAASMVDTDGDGIVDAVDSCPATPNPQQRDEDGDDVGNPCDGCPHLADPDQPDRDGDGVNDACDPSPADPGDRIFELLTFDDAGAPSGWSFGPMSGWDFPGDGEAVVTLTSDATSFLIRPTPSPALMMIATGFTIVAVNPPGGSIHREAGVILDYEPAVFGYSCVANHDTATMLDELLNQTLGTGATIRDRTDLGAAFVPGQRVDVVGVADPDADALRCASVASDTAALATGGYDPGTLESIGARARGITARFHYVVIIGR